MTLVLGALLTLGIGNYGPSLIFYSLVGVDPRAAFPIMMGSGAFVAAAAGVRFIEKGRDHARAALGLCLGGIPGVIVAVWLVTSLPLDVIWWMVIVVVGLHGDDPVAIGVNGGGRHAGRNRPATGLLALNAAPC